MPSDDMSCLAKVRAAPEDTAEALARQTQLLERARRLRDTEVLRNAMPNGYAPLPYFSLLPMTAHALAFVQGEEEYAVAETCRDLATWRRLAINTDMLVGTIRGITFAGRGHARLLADMLSEWPVDRPLPEACDAALAPAG